MSLIFTILYTLIFLAIFVGILFLQKHLTKKRILLGLILPLLSLCSSIIVDIEIISMIYSSYLGPRTIEQYKNGLLIQKSTIATSINIPITIATLVISNIPTIILFVIFLLTVKRKKELTLFD